MLKGPCSDEAKTKWKNSNFIRKLSKNGNQRNLPAMIDEVLTQCIEGHYVKNRYEDTNY